MTRYWQAEIYKDGELYDIDFPRRDTKDEAINDAWERWGSFSEREQQSREACVAEWEGDDEEATSTGNCEVVRTWSDRGEIEGYSHACGYHD